MQLALLTQPVANAEAVDFIKGKAPVVRRVFDHDGSTCDLVIDGLDTVAEVRINGHLGVAVSTQNHRQH